MITATWLAWYVAFTLFLLGMAWWPCCCDETYLCEFCDSNVPENLTVTLAFIGGAACTCDDLFSGTWILAPYDECEWRHQFILEDQCACYGVGDPVDVYVYFIAQVVVGKKWYVQTTAACENSILVRQTYEFVSAVADPRDCSEEVDVPYYQYSLGTWGGGLCQIAPVPTCVVNPT